MEHPLIISLREIFLTPTHLGMTMEYACGGDLHRYLLNQPGCRLPESEAKWIFQQLIIALDYSHRRGVSNRDLKLENLLLETSTDAQTRPVLKMCDFGYSKHEMNSSAKTVVGTATYMAPEILLGGLEKGTIYDAKKADAWAAGIILYALVFGRHPFNPDDPHHNRKLVACDYTLPNDSAVSVDCRRIIQSLLVADPVKRMSTHEVMNDPWFIDGIPSGALQMNERLLARHESEFGSNQGQKMPYRVDQLVEMACMPGSTDQEVLYLTL
jgi:serine/threonine-protein kinase SRK2